MMARRFHRSFTPTLLAAVLLVVLGVAPAVLSAAPGDNLDQLTPEQAVAARKMLVFMEQTEQEFFDAVRDFNGRGAIEAVNVDPDSAHYEIRIARGRVIEKAAVMTAITLVEKPPFVKGARWNRFFEVAVHPRTPKVGMLHATLVVQVGGDGTSTIAGTIDMMRAAQDPDDLAWFRARRDEVFGRHGVDPSKYVVGGCGKPNEGAWKWHRPSTCSGASIFGANLDVNEKNFDFVSDVFRSGMERYFELLKQRRRDRYNEDDIHAQDFMRRRWLEDQLFWDVLSRNFVPYEAWSAANAPPEVKF